MMKTLYIFLISISMIKISNAQLMPFGANFYHNQYLANPAMAGIKSGMHFNSGYNKQWSSIPGAPITQYFTFDNQFNKIGQGLSIYTDKAGLLKRTRILGSYAYHMPINSYGDAFHFGVSFGLLLENINVDDVNGNNIDLTIQRFNDRNAIFDGDFGIAYSTEKITVQSAIPNLNNFFRKEVYNTANWNTFFTAIHYNHKIEFNKNAYLIQPKISFRGVKGDKDILDVGVNISTLKNNIYSSLIYHSSQNITMGMGINYKDFTISCMYTTRTYALKGYSTGNLEVGLGYFVRTSSFKTN
jgi:type IX secretion system PorP/SprF family membrane protein